MLKTAHFIDQLAPSEASVLNSELWFITRDRLPSTLHGMRYFGMSQETIDNLQSISGNRNNDPKIEAAFLLSFFRGRKFCSRHSLERWLHKKGGVSLNFS